MTLPRPVPSPTGRASIDVTGKTGCARSGAADRQPFAGIPLAESEVETLRRENERLRAEVRVLGKIAGLEITGTTLKVRAVDDLKADHPLSLLLQIAGLLLLGDLRTKSQ